MNIRVGILTVSDTCSTGDAVDLSGPLLCELSEKNLGVVVNRACVPDNLEQIRRILVSWSDTDTVDLILTTGGTGFGPRDVTPEATLSILERSAPGLIHCMLSGSLSKTPLAALSRPAAGTRGATIIVNLPGSKKAVGECFGFLLPVLRHAVDLVRDRKPAVKLTHDKLQGDIPVHSCPHQHKEHIPGVGVAGRARESPYPMISVEEAQNLVLFQSRNLLTKVGSLQVLGTEKVSYLNGLGRILAQDVLASDPLPPFPASIKDGYAVISGDGAGVRTVRGESSAGYDPDMEPLKPGEIVRINTGAPVPPGADAVVMVENTKLVQATSDGEEISVEILVSPTPGLDIRPVGSDISEYEKVLSSGNLLGPGEVGVLAAVGVTEVEVTKLPVVTLLSTGNEIQPPGEKLKPGHVRDSNKTTLACLLRDQGFPVLDAGIARDNIPDLTSCLAAALQNTDILVTTGGVSMGDRDLLRQVLVSEFNATIHFARVNMKPGKPTTFATCTVQGKKKLILGLPGNPVSATVTCHLYVLPACRVLAGQTSPLPGRVRARLVSSYPAKLDPRPDYQRVCLSFKTGSSVGSATPTGNQISSRLTSVALANGLIILPPKTDKLKEIPVGSSDEFDVILIGGLTANHLFSICRKGRIYENSFWSKTQ
ncbi:gephyrin [Eurytemora carolleeae]|uniref:gephyrin n=1 Tax=Eurytemora carolleeae TaxID=1294199 RepID=UPI000C77928A|nr:gephyrin [Eurytemora carolleeae]XP_023335141.1 gephyrin [Eurytemora carolleeae]|eukprot:XP_023335132.1 gephyrin-like [Eurytemora affinis]